MATHLAIVIIGVSVVLDGAAKELALKPPSRLTQVSVGRIVLGLHAVIEGGDRGRRVVFKVWGVSLAEVTDEHVRQLVSGGRGRSSAEHGPDLTATEMGWRLFITLRSAVGGY